MSSLMMLYGKLLKLHINMAQDFLEAWLLQWPDARARAGAPMLWSISNGHCEAFVFFFGMMLAVFFFSLSLSIYIYMLYVYIYIYIESATWLVSAQVFDGHFLTLAMWRMTHGHGRQSIALDSNG